MANGSSNFAFAQRSETLIAISILVMLVVFIVPLPTFLLDMFLAVNLAAALILLLVVLGAKKPLDVSVFPSVLLLLTLFRLSLNVGTTRLILLNADAGKLVYAFGDFVVGGNLIVGIVIFLILVTIQFIVITKGATRISEVNARFTLDAMPGKQMAIDAELNTHAITEKQAKERREQLAREAEFYGAMDGASKYVRGDAIAGLVIMLVNIVGGVAIGMTEGQSITDALQIYSILTIGDGLVSQIPALVIATSAGMLVTKSSSESSLGDEIGTQLTRGYPALALGAFVMLVVAMTPGFPKLPFLAIGGALFLFVNYARQLDIRKQAVSDDAARDDTERASPVEHPEEKNLNEFLQMDRVVIEIGPGLISLVEPKKGNGIAARVGTLRENMANQYGFWIPKARIRSNLQIGAYEYRILVCGREAGRGDLMLGRLLAIAPGENALKLEGVATREPAFDLPAVWIDEANRRRAEKANYHVADPASVLITHLGECVRQLAHELLSREDMQKMLDKLKEFAPTTVDDIKPDTIRLSQLHQVLVNLLAEGVPITSLERIVEAGIYFGPQSKSIVELTERIRGAIGHLICEPFRNQVGLVRVVILEPRLEHYFRQAVTGQVVALAPASLTRLVQRLKSVWEAASIKNEPAALLVDSTIRYALKQTIGRSLRDVTVLAHSEIPGNTSIDARMMIRFDEVVGADDSLVDFDLALEQEGERKSELVSS